MPYSILLAHSIPPNVKQGQFGIGKHTPHLVFLVIASCLEYNLLGLLCLTSTGLFNHSLADGLSQLHAHGLVCINLSLPLSRFSLTLRFSFNFASLEVCL